MCRKLPLTALLHRGRRNTARTSEGTFAADKAGGVVSNGERWTELGMGG